MDLSTTYLGLKLKNPIIVSSSRLTSSINYVMDCAASGAGAIVLKSLYEEQLLVDKDNLMDQDEKYFWFPEAVDFINTHSLELGVAEYINLIKQAKEQTEIPIIASINCITPTEWPKFAAKLEEAGIDALELNISIMPFDSESSSLEIENTYLEIVTEVRKYTKVPIAVKIGPFFTNPLSLVKRLEGAGADGVVLFNRFYSPDIDIENEKVVRDIELSAPEEITQALRWVSLVSARVGVDVAGNTGIHDLAGVIKHLIVGAAATQICSTLYLNGIGYIDTILSGLEAWMQKKKYTSLSQFQGKLGRDEKNVAAFERVQFMKKTLTG